MTQSLAIQPPDGLFLSLCNELLHEEGYSLAEQCAIAKALGYRGLELAPGTLGDEPHLLSRDEILAVRRTVEDAGLVVTGLHWLLAPYPQASILQAERQAETADILASMIDQCAALGGTVLVHGSPSSRMLPPGMAFADALDCAAAFFRPLAKHAEAARVIYCFEPLSPAETSFINTIAEAQLLVDRVGSRAFATMLDTSAAGQSEVLPVADVLRSAVSAGQIAHIQVNDTNRGAPGMGTDPFDAIVAALRTLGWSKPIAVEPFKTVAGAVATAAVGAATMRALWTARLADEVPT